MVSSAEIKIDGVSITILKEKVAEMALMGVGKKVIGRFNKPKSIFPTQNQSEKHHVQLKNSYFFINFAAWVQKKSWLSVF